MPLFRCSITGEDFPGKILHQADPVGFYTTRYVEAETPEQAELFALERLRNDAALDLAPEHRSENARVYFESIEEVPEDTERTPDAGFVFFTMGT